MCKRSSLPFGSTEVMEDLQKLLPGFPRIAPQAPFLQVAPNVNMAANMLPMQHLQPTGQLEYKVPSLPLGASAQMLRGGHGERPSRPLRGAAEQRAAVRESFVAGAVFAAAANAAAAEWDGAAGAQGLRRGSQHPVARPAAPEASSRPVSPRNHDTRKPRLP